MRRLSAIAALIFFGAIFPLISFAQEPPFWEVMALNQIVPGTPTGSVDMVGDTATGTNGICVKYGETVLTADSATVNRLTGEAVADGHVRIEEGSQIWVGEHIRYNFKTHQMQSEQFRMGKPPVFAQGGQLQGDITNKTYNARHALVTTDDVSDPAIRVRASRIKIVPGKYVEMWNAVLFMDGVPTFYFPYYRRNLGLRANNFNFTPGYRSVYGPFLLNTYTWYLGDAVDGKLHLDYREKRGVGAGPDLNLHLGRWGEAEFKYYYLHDQDSNAGTNGTPWTNGIPENRQRFYLGYQATPFTNLNVKALVNWQSDPLVLHDFFEGAYRNNPQPYSFTEVNRYWNNWSLDAETTPLREPELYQYNLDLPAVAELWRRGSVVASWLLDLPAQALVESPDLANFSGRVSDSGEGRWTSIAAIDVTAPAPVLTTALYERFRSRGEADFGDKVQSAMRWGFGGHLEKKA